MKIKKSSFGNLKIYNGDNELLHIVPTDLVINLAGRDDILTLGQRLTDLHGISIKVSEVTEVDGVAFSGTKEDLAEILEGLMQNTTVLFNDFIMVKEDAEYQLLVDKNVATNNILIIKSSEASGTTTRTFAVFTTSSPNEIDIIWTGRAGYTYVTWLEV